MLTADDHRSAAPTATVAPPPPAENPKPLDKTEAIGMAIARLVMVGVGNHGGPTELLAVDEARSSLSVDADHAELRNLRVQTRSDKTWIALSACFELEGEWRVTSIGKIPGCGLDPTSAPP